MGNLWVYHIKKSPNTSLCGSYISYITKDTLWESYGVSHFQTRKRQPIPRTLWPLWGVLYLNSPDTTDSSPYGGVMRCHTFKLTRNIQYLALWDSYGCFKFTLARDTQYLALWESYRMSHILTHKKHPVPRSMWKLWSVSYLNSQEPPNISLYVRVMGYIVFKLTKDTQCLVIWESYGVSNMSTLVKKNP